MARGFGVLREKNPELMTAIARKGGKAAHEKGTAHEFTSEEAKRVGSLGGKASHAKRRAQKEANEQGNQSAATTDSSATVDLPRTG